VNVSPMIVPAKRCVRKENSLYVQTHMRQTGNFAGWAEQIGSLLNSVAGLYELTNNFGEYNGINSFLDGWY